MEDLKVVVTKINECEDTKVFEKTIDKYDIDNAVDNECEKMKKFNGFTGDIFVNGFKHVGTKTFVSDCEYEANWNDDVEIIIRDVENAHVTLNFIIINIENQEKEISLDFDTDFDY